MVWEVQVGASDLNGGGFKPGATGTDRTYPTSNPQAIGDLKTDGATLTVMVSATYTFVASDVGNVVSVNVSDSGGLATVGRYEIISVMGGKATVDRAWASGNNGATAGATAVLGGALATPGQAGKTLSTANEGTNAQKIFVKSGTYTLTTSTAGSGGPFTNSNRSYAIVEGYETTRGDLGAKPVLDAGVQTSVILWQHSVANAAYFVNLKADGQSGSGNKGFLQGYAYSSTYSCEAVDCDQAACYGFSIGKIIACKASNCYNGFYAFVEAVLCSSIAAVNNGFETTTAGFGIRNCLSHASGNDGFAVAGSAVVLGCAADANARYGFNGPNGGGGYVDFVNCVASNHSGVGGKGFTGGSFAFWCTMANCATYNNTANDTPRIQIGLVTLTADPYVDQANDDFRPNDTAGGGAALRAAGIGVYGQTDNRDIGAVQHTDSGGGYTYGDEDPSYVLTTATGAGTLDLSLYALLSGITWPALDAVDGGVKFGPVTGLEYEGTGVNATTLGTILDARGITTDNIALTVQPATSQEIRDAMKLAPSAGAAADSSIDDQLADILATGTGPYACTWTVEYSGTPLAGAVVAFWLNGALKGRGTTDANGQVPMSLAAGAYTVAIEVDGYVHTPETHTVSSTASTWTKTFDNLTAAGIVPAPTSAAECTGYGYTYDEDGLIEASQAVICRLIEEPNGGGRILEGADRTETSGVDGLVAFTKLLIGATYEFRRSGSTRRKQVTIAAADVAEDGGYVLPNFRS